MGLHFFILIALRQEIIQNYGAELRNDLYSLDYYNYTKTLRKSESRWIILPLFITLCLLTENIGQLAPEILSKAFQFLWSQAHILLQKEPFLTFLNFIINSPK